MSSFITENFLLQTASAVRLYHDYAKHMPLIDYHCHLSSREVAEDRQFDNITQIWLGGDHYKWRAMRSAGIDEKYITGSGSDREKFDAWSAVCPMTIRNPLFHWTMLELNRPFGINDCYLNPDTADVIWNRCNEQLAKPEFSARGIMKQMAVELVCTTDDPSDTLEYHEKIASDNAQGLFPVRVLPTFRPDKALPLICITIEGITQYKEYLIRLGQAADIEINSFTALRMALKNRHQYFQDHGCRLSDHGFGLFDWNNQVTDSVIQITFDKIFADLPLSSEETILLSSVLLSDFGQWDAEKGWTMQLHIGAMRDNSTRIYNILGPDAGCDSMIDGSYAKPLSRFFDALDKDGLLPRTIVYNLNPSSNYMLASLIANFNDGSLAGKMQYGSGWWFLDQMNGMQEQINTLSNMGLLSRFVGMLTDSRSFLSYTRHEYFRRILCNILGSEMEQGIIPNDFEWIGHIVQDISYNNAKQYFKF